MELKDTIEGMTSPDYKERFKAEYHQAKIRYEKLHNLVVKMDAAQSACESDKKPDYVAFCGFKPACSLNVLCIQCTVMGNYLHVLEVRAAIEQIEL